MEQLPYAVKCMHQVNVRASGEFRVKSGGGQIRALLSRLFGLPRPSQNAIVKLWVESEVGGERWIRRFECHRFITFQEPGARGEILESVGILQLRFRLTADARGVYYTQTGCALRFGQVHLQSPKWLSPSDEASETAEERRDFTLVKVSVRFPMVGKLLKYEGMIKPEGGAACT